MYFVFLYFVEELLDYSGQIQTGNAHKNITLTNLRGAGAGSYSPHNQKHIIVMHTCTSKYYSVSVIYETVLIGFFIIPTTLTR